MYESNITIVGHLGRDPEMRYTPSGTPVTDFSVAVDKSYTNDDGDKIERTKWFKVTCWRKLAEITAQYLQKGRLVCIEGEIDAEAWLNKDSKPTPTLKITARNIKFLGRANGNSAGQAASAEAEQPDLQGDDIPF